MSSALDTARATVEELIRANWTNPTTTIAWPNVPFTPPETGVYIAPHVLWGRGAISTKNGRNTVVGSLSVNVYSRRAAGGGPAHQSADDLRDLVNRVETSGVRFGAPSGPTEVPSADAAWVQYNVSVPFSVDEIVT